MTLQTAGFRSPTVSLPHRFSPRAKREAAPDRNVRLETSESCRVRGRVLFSVVRLRKGQLFHNHIESIVSLV